MADDVDDHCSSQSNKPHLHVRIFPTPTQISDNGGVSANGTVNKPLSSVRDSSPGESITVECTKEKISNDEELTRDSSKASGLCSFRLPQGLQWISKNWTWSKWKPALRGALAAWISLVIFVIPTAEDVMGQAAFLIIIASFFSPPCDPFVTVVEREFMILLFVGLGWAWLCLGLKLADLARTVHVSSVTIESIATGQYLQTAPSVIIAVFVFFGSAFYMYIRARQGPGPFLFASILGSLAIDVAFTTAALFPYPYYTIGQATMLPIIFHSAVALSVSIFVFPSSISTLFTTRLGNVLLPLADTVKQHRERLSADVTSPDFSAAPITAAVDKAEEQLTHLSAARRLLKLDIIYSRIAPTDYGEMHQLARRLVVRANGMSVYYILIDPTRERFPVTPAPSIAETPTILTPTPSRASSPDISRRHTRSSAGDATPKYRRYHRSTSPSRASSSHQVHRRHHRYNSHPVHHHNILHSSLLHLAHSQNHRRESAVGVFESHRYLNLEATRFSHPDSERHTARATELLSASCQDLLLVCESALCESFDWLLHIREHRFNFWMNIEEKDRIREDRIQKFQRLLCRLSQEHDEFTTTKRLSVLEPYRAMFDSSNDGSTFDDVPPHRYLFHCYVYQYHLIRFSDTLQTLLAEIIRLEIERKRPKLWFPSLKLTKLAFWSAWEPSENAESDDDENPEIIPGIDPTIVSDLGQAVRRDPDAHPPQNMLESIMDRLYHGVSGLGGGNALFAIKAGVLTVLLTLPILLKSSAEFAYRNKLVWAIFMSQSTLARFLGDTAFSIVARVFSTFVGGIMGTVMWYISTGSGQGNPYGLAAVCFVCFPLFFFVRLYWPVPPMTSMIIFVTAGLVVGYSYQDTHLNTPSSPGWGFDVAWRRFVLVAIGVLAAGIFSFLPPSTTIRSYQRRVMATTVAELGTIYCATVSFASNRNVDEPALIVQSLLAIRRKLRRSLVMKTNVTYEFSLRGRWPAERYQKILDIQLQLSYLLTHLLSVVEELEPAWARAFLKRTRLLDPDFQGDVLAVISLISTTLRTGSPLPQVTPCPLLNRFMERHHGFGVVHQEAEDDVGLPKNLTVETLESLQYLTFCVGVSTAFAIVTRLDRLMIATKELVGEQYHIDGMGLPLHYPRQPTGIEMRSPTLSLRQG
ncbi:hypothetical protein V8B97DRAFT_1930456 [Scleroderma yunnanense]